MRKVFLNELPKRGSFRDWKNSKGYVIKFIYDELEGYIKILDCDVKSKRYIYNIRTINYK